MHQVRDDEINEFEGTEEDWRLIGLAAAASSEVYKEAPDIQDGVTFKAKGNTKATVIYVEELNGQRVLVVAVRGTVTKEDWMLNANGTPKKSSKLLEGSATWHGGFLMVAEVMQKKTAKAVAEAATEDDQIDSILFTGHSAGGAIAQLFYAMKLLSAPAYADSSIGFQKVHCITFGAPPLASVHIPHGQPPLHKPGAFLSFINEGDPVPLAQEEYIKALIDVYVLSNDDLKKRYSQGYHVPPPRLRVSGTCVVLRDVDPHDAEQMALQACITNSEVVEKKLFGNPYVHPMKVYLERVKELGVVANATIDG
ncbi:hypothetical protein BZG36_02822 [Bifiguratus adelaidae]|uniref:Fungal lipase-type domain-containing protein n=1 Tax=Bifiguratus adelaidae TaxID=1938954 RepID=A0A261Y0K3_9FUNG|nr:hypothetical protein BZG36_02822 [Bifiguratus adelaidae]